MSKQEATYDASAYKEVMEGYYATLSSVDHPVLGPQRMVHTTRVISYDQATGVIETKNTIYRPKVSPEGVAA